jgi:hypothetical protein
LSSRDTIDTEVPAGVDGDELELRVFRGETPRGLLGERLALRVRRAVVHNGPVGLGAQPVLAARVPGVDRRDRRGQHHPPNAAGRACPQHAQRPLDGRPDQLVLVAGRCRGEGGGHVQHRVHAVDGRRPASVVGEVGLDELQLAAELPQVGDPRRVGERADGAADRVAVREQVGDAVPGDEPGRAGDQHCGHLVLPI